MTDVVSNTRPSPTRAGRHNADPNDADPNDADPNDADPNAPDQNAPDQNAPDQNDAGQDRADPHDAGQDRAGPNDAGRNRSSRNRGSANRTNRGSTNRGGPAVTAVAVLSAVVVALAVSGAALLILRHNLRHEQDVRQNVLNAARQQALNMITLDARTVDRDYERMLAGAADPLRADLENNRAAAKQALARSKGVSSGTVSDAGLVQMLGDRASAVVIVDAVQTNTVTGSSLSHRFRFQLDLTRQGERWLVANLESVDICGSGSSSEPGCAATPTQPAQPTQPTQPTRPTPKPSTTKR
jgi:hypothetical protein